MPSSSRFQPRPRARSLPRPLAACFTLAAAGFCTACSGGSGRAADDYVGDGVFGRGIDDTDASADLEDGGTGSDDTDAIAGGSSVRLRVLTGALNIAAAYVCHDPDYVVDDLLTPEDETDPGPLPAIELLLPADDAGVFAVGEASSFVQVAPIVSGAITVHRAREDAGSDAALPSLDAGSPAPLDADLDDAGDDAMDAALPEALPSRCLPENLEAVLPIPTPRAWLNPQFEPDAALTLEARGFVERAEPGDTLTLFGSGLALDPSELERRREAARLGYLNDHPGRESAARAAGREAINLLDATYGPRYLLSRNVPAPAGRRFSLYLAHLISDVPSAPAGPDGPGALHLCVTAGTSELTDLPLLQDGGVEFRNHAAVGDGFDPRVAYRFRVFVRSAYEVEQKTCATTSLKPVAELQVEAGRFRSGSAYGLVAWGAIAPEAVCSVNVNGSLVRAGCSKTADMLRARLDVLEEP